MIQLVLYANIGGGRHSVLPPVTAERQTYCSPVYISNGHLAGFTLWSSGESTGDRKSPPLGTDLDPRLIIVRYSIFYFKGFLSLSFVTVQSTPKSRFIAIYSSWISNDNKLQKVLIGLYGPGKNKNIWGKIWDLGENPGILSTW